MGPNEFNKTAISLLLEYHGLEKITFQSGYELGSHHRGQLKFFCQTVIGEIHYIWSVERQVEFNMLAVPLKAPDDLLEQGLVLDCLTAKFGYNFLVEEEGHPSDMYVMSYLKNGVIQPVHASTIKEPYIGLPMEDAMRKMIEDTLD